MSSQRANHIVALLGLVIFNLPFALKVLKKVLEFIGFSTAPEDTMGLFEKLSAMPWYLAVFMAFAAWATYLLYPAVARSVARTAAESGRRPAEPSVRLELGSMGMCRVLPLNPKFEDIPPDYLVTFAFFFSPVTITNTSRTDRAVLHFQLRPNQHNIEISFSILDDSDIANKLVPQINTKNRLRPPIDLGPQHSVHGSLTFISTLVQERRYQRAAGEEFVLIVRDVISDTVQEFQVGFKA